MATLTFYYGVMGCSKSANALMTRYEQMSNGRKVWLIKPAIDTRDNIVIDGKSQALVKSRVGISAPAEFIYAKDHIQMPVSTDIIICDEAQFLQPKQVDELNEIAKDLNIPVMCYGLRTDFMTHFFPGSKRLFEIADRLVELETDCKCGKKAVISAKFLGGKLVTEGEQIDIGGDEKYKAMCYSCWEKYKLAEGLDIEYKVE
jgi:thymidine kinase